MRERIPVPRSDEGNLIPFGPKWRSRQRKDGGGTIGERLLCRDTPGCSHARMMDFIKDY